MKRYKSIYTRFSEELRLSDLRKDAGISDLTMGFKKTRTKEVGSESNNAKLVNFKINREKDYVDFVFITIATPYPNKDFPDDDDHFYGEINPPETWEIRPNTSEEYDMAIRVFNFLEWLDTAPEKITNKDIQDVMETANIAVSCTCPSFNWQGFAHKLTTFDASIYPQSIPDPVWGPRHNDDGLVCKHLSGLVGNIKFFIPQMRQMVKKELV